MIELVSAVSAFKASGSEFAVPLLRSLVGYESQTSQQLGRIERKLEGVLQGSYREARNDLETAADERLPETARRERLEHAARCLSTAAAGFEESGEWRLCSCASLDLAVIKLAEGATVEADIWAHRAYRAAVTATEQAVEQSNRKLNARLARRFSLFSPLMTRLILGGFLALALASFLLPQRVRVLGVSVPYVALVLGGPLLYLESRFLYSHLVAWRMRRQLAPHLQFLSEQVHASRSVLESTSESLTSYTLAQTDDELTGVLHVKLVPE